MLAGVSTNGTSILLVQLGDGGGIETSGYNGGVVSQTGTVTGLTSGFLLTVSNGAASNAWESVLELTLENASAFTWLAQSCTSKSDSVNTMIGRKSTSAAMTTVRLTTVNGSDTFDAGAVNVLYS